MSSSYCTFGLGKLHLLMLVVIISMQATAGQLEDQGNDLGELDDAVGVVLKKWRDFMVLGFEVWLKYSLVGERDVEAVIKVVGMADDLGEDIDYILVRHYSEFSGDYIERCNLLVVKVSIRAVRSELSVLVDGNESVGNKPDGRRLLYEFDDLADKHERCENYLRERVAK